MDVLFTIRVCILYSCWYKRLSFRLGLLGLAFWKVTRRGIITHVEMYLSRINDWLYIILHYSCYVHIKCLLHVLKVTIVVRQSAILTKLPICPHRTADRELLDLLKTLLFKIVFCLFSLKPHSHARLNGWL